MESESNQEMLHQIWLQCMQMNQCNPQTANSFLAQTYRFLNFPLTVSGQTLLMVACSIGSTNIVKAALNYKPNPHLKDSIGRTALHYTAAVGCIEIFQLLIQVGSNSLQQTIGGQTPLAKACMFSQGDIIEWYLNNELRAFEIADNLGKKPLQILKISGEALYQQVSDVYQDLTYSEMKE